MRLTSYSSIDPLNFKQQSTSLSRVCTLGLILASPSILLGAYNSFTTVALPQLNLSLDDASWFASIAGFSAPFGSILIGIIIDRFGRRTALLAGILPTFIGWTCIYLNNSVTWLLIGCSLNGLSVGSLVYAPQVYASECLMVNHQRLCDSFKMWTSVANAIGSASVFLLAMLFDYRQLSAIMVFLSLLEFSLIYYFIHESPSWLLYRGRSGDAEWSQRKLRIYPPVWEVSTSDPEINEETTYWYSTVEAELRKMKRKDVYKPLIIMITLFLFLIWSGGMVVVTYMVEIMGEKSTSSPSKTENPVQSSDSFKYSVISGFVILVANLTLCFILPYLGAKKVTISALIGMGIGQALLAYTVLVNRDELYLLHVASVWLVVFMYNFGIYNLCPSILGVLFPLDAKGYASIIAIELCMMLALTIKVYPYLKLAIGGYLFYYYSMVAFCGAIYAYFFMPETVGKTLAQISQQFL